MMGVAATVIGFGFLAPGVWAKRPTPNCRRCERPVPLFHHRTSRLQLFRHLLFPFWVQPVFPQLPVFYQEYPRWWPRQPLRAGAEALPVWLERRLPALWLIRAEWFCGCGGAPAGLRHAQIADGRLRHRLHVRAQAGTGDFLLKFSRLPFEFAGAPVQRDFVGGFGLASAGSLFRRRRIHSPRRKLVRNSRLMRHRAE